MLLTVCSLHHPCCHCSSPQSELLATTTTACSKLTVHQWVQQYGILTVPVCFSNIWQMSNAFLVACLALSLSLSAACSALASSSHALPTAGCEGPHCSSAASMVCCHCCRAARLGPPSWSGLLIATAAAAWTDKTACCQSGEPAVTCWGRWRQFPSAAGILCCLGHDGI